MPGLNSQVVMQRLNVKPDVKPVMQQQWRFRPDFMEAIKAEVYKLIKYGFIQEDQHQDWVANIVLVLKKNENIRVCIDFHDLNTACPKKEFSLPITDVMIDNTCGFKRMSFMVVFRVQSNQDVPRWWKTYVIQNAIGSILLHSNVIRI